MHFSNGNYRAQKTKLKSEKYDKYRDWISFAQPKIFESQLIYNDKIFVEEIICESFQAILKY